MRRVRHLVAGLAVGVGAVAVGNAAPVALEYNGHQIPAGDVNDSGVFDDLLDLVTQFEASGEVGFAGARRLEVCVDFARHNVERGTPSGAIFWLEQFKATASQPRYVPSESARDELIAAADQVIQQLSSNPSPAPARTR